MRIAGFISSLLIMVLLFIIVSACDNGLSTSEDNAAIAGNNPDASIAAVDTAFSALENGYFDKALSEFSKAVLEQANKIFSEKVVVD